MNAAPNVLSCLINELKLSARAHSEDALAVAAELPVEDVLMCAVDPPVNVNSFITGILTAETKSKLPRQALCISGSMPSTVADSTLRLTVLIQHGQLQGSFDE